MSFYNPPYKLRNWVSLEKLDWGSLSRNLNGIELLLENYDKIVWDDLSRNENAIDILKENMEKIDWDQTTSKSICQNKNAIGIIKSNLHKVTDWYNLSKNESAIELLENDKNQISWFCPYWDECIYDIDGINFLKDKFSKEKLFCWWNLENNPMAIAFLKENLDKVNWGNLSKNKWTIDIIKGNLDKIDDWYNLSSNPKAIEILEDNFENIDWWGLSLNPEAIHILKEHPDKINWLALVNNTNGMDIIRENLDKLDSDCWLDLSANPSIFEIDYNKIKNRIAPYKEELIAVAMNPTRFARYLYEFNYDIGEDMLLDNSYS